LAKCESVVYIEHRQHGLHLWAFVNPVIRILLVWRQGFSWLFMCQIKTL